MNKLEMFLASLTIGGNNYVKNCVEYVILDGGVIISTSCRNEYGGNYGNEDETFVPKSALPNWVCRKLYL